VAARAGEKSLDSTVRRCIIVTGCFGRRKSVEADGDTEDPVTRKIVMPSRETISGWEILSEAGLGLLGHKGL
jgi:hypothetical protein